MYVSYSQLYMYNHTYLGQFVSIKNSYAFIFIYSEPCTKLCWALLEIKEEILRGE